jgi:hypothetical protein
MLKYMVMTLVIGMSLLQAGNAQEIQKLEAEKKVLELKLEAYALKKKIIEMEKFLEQEQSERKAKVEREKALIQLKNDLRANRNNTRKVLQGYAG